MSFIWISLADVYSHLKRNKEIQLIILGGAGVKQGGVAVWEDWAARSAGTTAVVQTAGCPGGQQYG